MILALGLALLMGVTLGLFGGGGSILTVPVLTYVVGVAPRTAFAASLLIVAFTSTVALLTRRRSGQVEWRTGWGFGLAAMLGAYTGGHLSRYLPEALLLFGFGALMLLTAVAMLRGRPRAKGASGLLPKGLPRMNIALYGLGVGLVSGLVGAGGGFLIVPALVLFGRMPIQKAISTSLLVIAMQSTAGFLGHVGEVAIPWLPVAAMALLASFGSTIGGRLQAHVRPETLQRGFAWMVMSTALVMLAHQTAALGRGADWYDALFVTRWPWWLGGLAIAAVVLGLLFVENKQLGVSTGFGEVCRLPIEESARRSWRPRFLLGIVLGGALAAVLSGHFPNLAMGTLDTLAQAPASKLALLFGSGLAIGVGSRLAGGCTSGHSIVGVALGSRASLLATALFMFAGLLTTQALLRWTGL